MVVASPMPESPPAGESLTIVIPALNEEGAIGDTITRCMEASAQIKSQADLSDVEIIVVSDGSTDRTAEIAKGFSDVKVIVFRENRGYGAAIKEGWRIGRGTLLGFLDADGTCDPRYFASMCETALTEDADIVLGSRLGPNSKMPKVRRLGNRIYAFLLGLLCGRAITDTASGMRVVRRRSLKYLYPLPDGLHFTPSMSARALLNDLRLVEMPMDYSERVGRSKLSVVHDGVRFLRAIFAGVLCYRPEKLLLLAFITCALLAMLFAAYPTEFYFQHRRLEEWMIYRFVICYILGSCGLMLLLATALTSRMASFGPRRQGSNSFWPAVVASVLSGKSLWLVLGLLLAAALFFLWPGFVEYWQTKSLTLHWSRLIAGAFSLFSALQTIVFAFLMEVVSVWLKQVEQTQFDKPARRQNAIERHSETIAS
jgi:glycosyltransferase involved in cell wall biosynthesis